LGAVEPKTTPPAYAVDRFQVAIATTKLCFLKLHNMQETAYL